MRTTARERGFTLVEVLASIAAFTIVFLAGFGGLGKLLLTQDQNYARTMAASAAMLLTDWHISRAITAPPGPFPAESANFIDNTTLSANNGTKANILFEVTTQVQASTALSTLKFIGYDFTGGSGFNIPPATERFFVFLQNSTDKSVIDSIHNAVVDLTNNGENQFTTSEYKCLLVSVSPQSTTEADSKLRFRQVSFWYGPPQIIDSLRPAGATITVNLELVGRFLIPDTFVGP